jgi:UDPglucose 6-dehydrogenase
MNELANLAERLGADIELVRQGMGSDPRIGTQFLYPGCGYGGSCFPKDVKALGRSAQEVQMKLHILDAVEAVNERQKERLVEKVVARFGADLTGRRFALWGLAFKPGTDDMREAPSLTIIRGLLQRGATLAAYDPVATREARRLLEGTPGVTFADSAEAALAGCDALLIVTEWKEFRSPDFAGMRKTLKEGVVFDGRNIYEPRLVQDEGLEYHGIGRGAART